MRVQHQYLIVFIFDGRRMKAEVSGFGFLFSLPAVGGLLPPVAGRDGAAAEKFIFLELLSSRNALHYVTAFLLKTRSLHGIEKQVLKEA